MPHGGHSERRGEDTGRTIVDGVIRTQLKNELTVLLKPLAGAPVASLFMWYRVGSRNEVDGRTGISHWVEHMLFRG
ncbi:MAG: insulinase family protein, partial [Anaerolineae bacterium]|nr:insulinase family protein [Anaerolineae bacterium]